jgi:Arc/MetJ-type ribon-helix-helix transcriptional regulator
VGKEANSMARTKSIENGVKYTVVLPESSINELKELVENRDIPSVNAAVREAIEEYIVKAKNENYQKALQDAVKDPEFIKRNKAVARSYESSDKEAEEMIPEW